MSLEDETLELSLLYHGQREYVEALQELVRDMSLFLAYVPELDIAYYDAQDWKKERDALQQRANELLGQAREGE